MKPYYTGACAMSAGFGLGSVTGQVLRATNRTVAEVEATDPQTYMQDIAVRLPPRDGHFIARGGRQWRCVTSSSRVLGLPGGSGDEVDEG
jgi:hypothetical protein